MVPGPVAGPRLERQGDVLTGTGLGVAKGPAAAALLGYLLATRALDAAGVTARAALLLAAGGTHRAAPRETALPAGSPATGAGDGVRRYLTRHHPSAAMVAKCGPPGVLYEEPGAAYLTVEVTGPAGLAMARAALPGGGVPGAAGAAIGGFEAWRAELLARPLPVGSQCGRDAAVGALAAGLPYKADLVAGLLQLHVYAVLAPGDDPAALAVSLAAAVESSLAAAGRDDLAVHASVVEATAAAATDPASPVVEAARAAYRAVLGTVPPDPVAWTGSTDGVLFRHAGVDTARMGPVPLPGPLGQDALSLGDLVAWTRVYATAVIGWSEAAPE